MEKYQAELALTGRILLSGLMFYAALFNILNWSTQVAMLINLQVPLPAFSLGVATAVEIVLGLPLVLGFQTRWAAFLLALYVLVTTFFLHAFWATEPSDRANETFHFVECLGVTGGLLAIAAFGPGRISIDAKRAGNGPAAGNAP